MGRTGYQYEPMYSVASAKHGCLSWQTIKAVGRVIVVVACCISIGVIIGYYSRDVNSWEDKNIYKKLVKEADPTISRKIQDGIDVENIRTNLQYFSRKSHLAGRAREKKLVEYIQKTWKGHGLDSVEVPSYDVLLSYPNVQNPNKVEIIDANGDAVFTSALFEKVLSPEQNNSDIVPPFNAFAPAGAPQGELVYVNYARSEDFKKLKALGVNCTDKIVIARYGKIFRGNKVKEAHKAGAKGIILYSDPADYAVDGVTSVYPHSWWLPGTGVQRGNVILQKGDPLTPGYPATDDAYRITTSELQKHLPQIPCHPIGYDDAKELLRHLGGPSGPAAWQGKLDIGTYRLGPGFRGAMASSRVRLIVNNENKRTKIHNVIGKITGFVEPDRYILVGNHRDAWAFGAFDPSSGTAVMMELVRVLASLVKNGWRPRRTIMFCSWGAEEHGLVGSTEWVEENTKTLLSRAVAYLNVDTAVRGNFTFKAKASPLLRKLMAIATTKVPDPVDPTQTIYDTWRVKAPQNPAASPTQPKISLPGSGSDFAPFIQLVGLPATDHSFTYSQSLGISSYPLYHSAYETFSVIQSLDPTFRRFGAVGQVWGEMVRMLSDEYVLPLDAEGYAESIQGFVNHVEEQYGSKVRSRGISLAPLKRAAEHFSSMSKMFHQNLDKADKKDPVLLRRLNDKLIYLERAFTDPAGLPGRPLLRHLILAPSSIDHYAGSSFPGLADLLYNIDSASDRDLQWEKVKKHLSVLAYTIRTAANTLALDSSL